MKSLSELLAEVEPSSKWIDLSFSHLTDTPYDHVKPCNIIDRASYDKLKAIAVELANKIEESATLFQTNWTCGTCVEVNNDCYKPLVEALTTARKLMGDE